MTQLESRYPHARSVEAKVKLPKSSHTLPLCNHDVELHAASIDVGRTRVRATCNSPSWTTRGTVNSIVVTEALVAVHSAKKGHRLVATDYRMSEVILRTPQKPYYFHNAIEGRKLKRKIRSGEVITYKHIDHDYVVKKGDAVEMTYLSDTFSLSTDGIAEENGIVGDHIKVRNSQSGKLLRATVTGKQRVTVD